MKTIVTFILLSIITTRGCHKSSAATGPNPVNITGVWELSKTTGGNIRGRDFPAGNGNVIKFSGDKYEVWVDNQLSNSGTFELIKDNAGNFIITYQSSNTSKDTVLLEGNQLTLKPSHPDFATRIYKKDRQ